MRVFKFPKLNILETSIFRFFRFFPKFNTSLIYKAIIVISVTLPMLNNYKFCKKRNVDPTTLRTSRTTSRWLSTQKVWATQNFKKEKMTGRVDILRRIFDKNEKKLKWRQFNLSENILNISFFWVLLLQF